MIIYRRWCLSVLETKWLNRFQQSTRWRSTGSSTGRYYIAHLACLDTCNWCCIDRRNNQYPICIILILMYIHVGFLYVYMLYIYDRNHFHHFKRYITPQFSFWNEIWEISYMFKTNHIHIECVHIAKQYSVVFNFSLRISIF